MDSNELNQMPELILFTSVKSVFPEVHDRFAEVTSRGISCLGIRMVGPRSFIAV